MNAGMVALPNPPQPIRLLALAELLISTTPTAPADWAFGTFTLKLQAPRSIRATAPLSEPAGGGLHSSGSAPMAETSTRGAVIGPDSAGLPTAGKAMRLVRAPGTPGPLTWMESA